MFEYYYFLRARIHNLKSTVIPINHHTNHANATTAVVSLDSYLSQCQSGDLFFFQSDRWSSRKFDTLTDNHFSNVGLIMRSPYSNQAFILTSNEFGYFPPRKSNKDITYHNKVDLTPLKAWVESRRDESLHATFAFRALILQNKTNRRELSERIARFAVRYMNKSSPNHHDRWLRYRAYKSGITHRGKLGEMETYSSPELCFLALIHAQVIQEDRIGDLEAPWSLQIRHFEEGSALESCLKPGCLFEHLTLLL